MKTTTENATGPRVRRSWTREEKRQHVEAWRRSGWSRLDYCQRQELGYGTFGRWVKSQMPPSDHRFAAVEVKEPGESSIELIAPNGWRVKVSMTLAEVMEAVGRC